MHAQTERSSANKPNAFYRRGEVSTTHEFGNRYAHVRVTEVRIIEPTQNPPHIQDYWLVLKEHQYPFSTLLALGHCFL